MRKPPRHHRGLSFAEILCAIGFLAVFTTGLLAIATKGCLLSRQQDDMAAAYRHGESCMERYAAQARDPGGWRAMAPVTAPAFPETQGPGGESVPDTRFVYTVSVSSLDSDLRQVVVAVYRAQRRKAAKGIPAIDTSALRGGEVLRFHNLYQQEVQRA